MKKKKEEGAAVEEEERNVRWDVLRARVGRLASGFGSSSLRGG